MFRSQLAPLAILLSVVLLLIISFGLVSTQEEQSDTRRSIPMFTLPDLRDGPPVTAAQFAGRPWVLNVWASWCIPCRAEVPFLAALVDQGVELVGLNYKDEPATALLWLERYGDPFTVHAVDASGTTGRKLGVEALPVTFVVDAAGTITYRHIGAIDDEADLRAMLAAWRAAQELQLQAA